MTFGLTLSSHSAGGRRCLLQINAAIVSRAADLSALTSSPFAECFVFPPLISFQSTGSHVAGSVAVLELQPATTIAWQTEGISLAAAAAEPPLDAQWSSSIMGCSSEYDDGERVAFPTLSGKPVSLSYPLLLLSSALYYALLTPTT